MQCSSLQLSNTIQIVHRFVHLQLPCITTVRLQEQVGRVTLSRVWPLAVDHHQQCVGLPCVWLGLKNSSSSILGSRDMSAWKIDNYR